MSKIVVDAQLLESCLEAFNMLPNRKLLSGQKTYDLASELDRVLDRKKAHEQSEVLQRYVDSLAAEIIREVSVSQKWKEDPYLSQRVIMIQEVVKALNQVDRFNYNMDMLERVDLTVPLSSTKAA